MVRFPSAIFGIVSVYAIYQLAKVLFGKREALFSAFIMSVSLYHIIYSQEAARPYAAFVCFTLLSFYYLYLMLATRKIKYWIGFIAANILNLYTHSFSLFVLAEEAAIWSVFIFRDTLIKSGQSVDIRGIFNFFRVLSAIFIAGMSDLKRLLFGRHLKKPGALWYALRKTTLRFNIKEILKFLCSMVAAYILSKEVLGTFGFRSYLKQPHLTLVFNPAYYKNLICRYGSGNGLAFFIYTFFFIMGIATLFLKKEKKSQIFSLIFCLIFPFSVLSFMDLQHFFHIRYVIFTYPLYILIVSKGIANFLNIKFASYAKNLFTAVIIVIFGFLSIAPLKYYYQMPARLGDWRGVADHIYRNTKDSAKVITIQGHATLIKYYLDKNPQPKNIGFIFYNEVKDKFEDILANKGNENFYCVFSGGSVDRRSDEFTQITKKYLKDKVIFFSPAYLWLGNKELIDWHGDSWFEISIRRYLAEIYFNKNR
jgi:4-amino-4-deoxy-L-arabinose transferase-like glycosyltransferase